MDDSGGNQCVGVVIVSMNEARTGARIARDMGNGMIGWWAENTRVCVRARVWLFRATIRISDEWKMRQFRLV